MISNPIIRSSCRLIYRGICRKVVRTDPAQTCGGRSRPSPGREPTDDPGQREDDDGDKGRAATASGVFRSSCARSSYSSRPDRQIATASDTGTQIKHQGLTEFDLDWASHDRWSMENPGPAGPMYTYIASTWTGNNTSRILSWYGGAGPQDAATLDWTGSSVVTTLWLGPESPPRLHHEFN